MLHFEWDLSYDNQKLLILVAAGMSMELVVQKNFRKNIWRFSMEFLPGIAIDVIH